MRNAKIDLISENGSVVHFDMSFNSTNYDILVGTTSYWFGEEYYIAILNLHISARISDPHDVYYNYDAIRKVANAASLDLSDAACFEIAKAIQDVFVISDR